MADLVPNRSGAGKRSLLLLLAVLGCLLGAAYLLVLRGEGASLERSELEPVTSAAPLELASAQKAPELTADSANVGESGAGGRDAAFTGVRLVGDGKLTGVVLDRETGVGVGGARVELLPMPPVGSAFLGRALQLARLGEDFVRRAKPVAVTTADTLGSFSFEGVREGRYYVDVSSEYYLLEAPQRVDVLASGDGGPAEVWVREGGRVLGQVLDPAGAPVASATVLLTAGPNLFLESAREGTLRVVETRADEDGRFAFGGVAPGDGYDLTATAPRIASSHLSEVNVLRGEDTRVVVRSRAGGTVVGRVFSAELEEDGDDRGRVALPGAHVGAIPRGLRDLRFLREVLEQTHCQTDEDGAYRMTHVPPGDVDIVVFAPDHVLGAGALVVVGEGEVTSAAPITMEAGEKVFGRVLDAAGSPIAGVDITWPTFDFRSMRRRGMDLTFAPFLAQAVEGFVFPKTDSEGRFAAGPFPGDPPHRIRLYKAGYQEVEVECAPGGDELEVVLRRGGAIEGLVMDLDEAVPVERFSIQTIDRVELTADSPGRFNPFSGGQTFEEPSGRFVLDSMRPGEVEFTVSAPGYMPKRVSGVVVEEGETKRGVIVTLVRGGVLRGVVVDDAGEPIAGAAVMAFDPSVERGREFRQQRDPSKLPDRLPRFSEGLPPALLGYAAGLGLLADDAVRSGRDGSFELVGVPAGSLSVVAFHPKYASGASEELVLEEGGSVEGLRIELSSGASIYGTVKDRHGRPMSGSMVVAMSPSRFAGNDAGSVGGGLYQTQTDLEGAYELENMSSGSFFIMSMRGDEALNPLSFFSTLDFDLVTIPAEERVPFDIVDESFGGTRVFGRVLDDGLPVPRGNINAISWEGENVLGVDWKLARIDSEGRYEFEGLAPGEYQFQLEGLTRRVRMTVEIPDVPEHRLDLELPRGVIEGRVVDDVTGEPVARARVFLRPRDQVESDSLLASLVRQGGDLYRERTDGEGRFSFKGLSEGDYELYVDPADSRSERSLAPSEAEDIGLARDEVRAGFEVRLRTAAELTGVVRDDSGAPVGGASVSCTRSDEPDLKPKRARSGEDGLFRITGISAGEHSLIVSAPGYANSRLDGLRVDGLESEEVELVLERGVAVTLDLTGADGAPLSGASARLVRTDAPDAGSEDPTSAVRALFSGRGTTDAAGQLELGRFQRGTYELSVWRGLSRKRVSDIQLGRDDSVRLRVTLD